MNSANLSLGSIYDATVATSFLRRLLPDAVAEEPIRVDVRVRSYDDTQPLVFRSSAINSKTGRRPVGTLLDCYV